MYQRMFLVYIETLKMSIGDERLEKLANTIIFRDDGGIFRRENYCFCGKDMLFRILLMANRGMYTLFLCQLLTQTPPLHLDDLEVRVTDLEVLWLRFGSCFYKSISLEHVD